MSIEKKTLQIKIYMLPLEYPCGPESSCCGPVGQSQEEVEALKKAMEAELSGAEVEVIDAGDRKIVEEQTEGGAVKQLLSSFGAQALPIIALNGEVACMGSLSSQEAVVAIREKLN